MRKLFQAKNVLWVLALLFPLLVQAQNESKYLVGAVPEENGKVVFTTQIVTEGHNKASVMQHMKAWAEKVCKRKEVIDHKSRVVITDEQKGEIVVTAEEYMVFADHGLSLDRTRIYYYLRIFCEDNMAKIQMQNIKYWYDENRDGGTRYTAEEAISDKECLYKNNTKMYKSLAKFRIHTCDLKDELFNDAAKAFGYQESIGAKRIEPTAAPVKVMENIPTPKPIQKKEEAKPVQKKEEAKPVELANEDGMVKRTHIAYQPERAPAKETVTFSVQTNSALYDLLEKSGKATITVISENGTAQVLQFLKIKKENGENSNSCTFTGELSK